MSWIEINVLSDRRYLTYNNLAVTVDATSLDNAITDVLSKLKGGARINVLRFFGHGQPGCQDVGDGKIGNRIKWSSTKKQLLGKLSLERLKGRFEKGGWIELRGCNVADGEEGKKLLREIAELLGVVVIAGAGLQTDTGDVFEWENSSYHASPGQAAVPNVPAEKKWPPQQ